MSELGRRPPAETCRELRKEVGFGCPVPGCGSPYLSWHHFDPPWRERRHHDPKGMVALCREHHPEADAGAFSKDQLRAFKTHGLRNSRLGARLNWMRRDLVAIVGGTCYVDCWAAVQIQDAPVVWFNRDEVGNLLVNVQQISAQPEPRMLMLDNFWMTEGHDAADIECPPSGRRVKATYANGDRISIEFQEHESWDEFEHRLGIKRPPPPPQRVIDLMDPETRANMVDDSLVNALSFPLTTVAVGMTVVGTELNFGPRSSDLAGVSVSSGWVRGAWSDHVRPVGLQVGDPNVPLDPRSGRARQAKEGHPGDRG